MSDIPFAHLSRFCAEQSRQLEQPIYGTAAGPTTVWFLLEYDQPWQARAVIDNALPPPVQGWLDQQLKNTPQSRLLFIKRPNRTIKTTYRFYIAIAGETEQRLYRFELASYEALWQIGVAALLAQADLYAAQRVDEVLYLVCTHGKRDQCCAKFGLPAYHAFVAQAPQSSWQCTHLGGHRYAAVAAVLPHGVYYGQIQPQQVPRLATASAQGEVILSGYRGRTCYAPTVQAAEYFLRQHTQNRQLNAFALQSAAETEVEGAWEVRFTERTADVHYAVRLAKTMSEPSLASCTTAKYKARPLYALTSVEQVASAALLNV